MNVNTGATYPSIDAALDGGEKRDELVEVRGTSEQVRQISTAVQAQAKAKRRAANKRARASRKRNRR